MRHEVVLTNVYKLRRIVDWIRNQGRLPTDEFGQILPVDDLMGWFGLNECLTMDEQLYIERELKGIIEAESTVLRLGQVRSDMS
ncbi:MAG: hypothetical protein ISS70_01595 [Phycisphaerae bacterium]|nr:hypothetical protein [Phycisphaerae bacterium]